MEMKKITNCKYNLKYDYYITDSGNVYSGKTNKYLKTVLDKDGYVKVRMISTDNKRHRYSVHRLIMENFNPIDNMTEMQVNHIDGNKQNNNIKNLEWVSCSENIQHAYDIGLKKQNGENNNASKLTDKEVKEIIQLLLSKKYTGKEISRMYNLNDDYANSIRRKERWSYLTHNIDFN